MKKLKDLTKNQVVQTTKENDLQFRKLLHKEGFKRLSGGLYTEHGVFCNHEIICYKVKDGTYGGKDFYQKNGFEILQASDFLTPKIKKSELLERIEVLEKKVAELEGVGKGTIEAEQPQFEVGKVYKKNDSLIIFYCTEINDNEAIGFGMTYDGSWLETARFVSHSRIHQFTEATPEEWFKRVEEERIKRGFVKGVRFNSPNATQDFSFNQQITKENFELYTESRVLGCSTDKNPDGGNIMDNGKWAEIIEEPQYQAGTLGAFWDGDFDEALSKRCAWLGTLDSKTKSGQFVMQEINMCYQNFKPLKFD